LPVRGMIKPGFDEVVWFGLAVAGTEVLAGTLVAVLTGTLVEVGVEVNPPCGVLVAVWVGVDELTVVGVLVAVFVAVLTGVVGVDVGVLVAVFVAVFVAVLVGVFVAVLVAVFVAVLTGVLVGVFVAVFVAVLVGVLVAVFVAVLTGPAVTTRVPLAVAVPAWHPDPLPASTEKVVEPAGVPADVVRVSVEDASAPVLVTEAGLNTAVTPLGNAEVMLKGDVQELFVPLKLTVMG